MNTNGILRKHWFAYFLPFRPGLRPLLPRHRSPVFASAFARTSIPPSPPTGRTSLSRPSSSPATTYIFGLYSTHSASQGIARRAGILAFCTFVAVEHLHCRHLPSFLQAHRPRRRLPLRRASPTPPPSSTISSCSTAFAITASVSPTSSPPSSTNSKPAFSARSAPITSISRASSNTTATAPRAMSASWAVARIFSHRRRPAYQPRPLHRQKPARHLAAQAILRTPLLRRHPSCR